jgi:hypothetical protein
MRIFIILVLTSFFSVQTKEKRNVVDFLHSIVPQNRISITERDVKNGFVRFNPIDAEGISDFVIWKRKDGSTLAGLLSLSCGPACIVDSIEFYEFKRNSLKPVKVTEKVLDKKKIEKLVEQSIERINTKGSVGDETLWIVLPRKGKDIEFGVMQDQLGSDTFIKAGLAKFDGKGFKIFSR